MNQEQLYLENHTTYKDETCTVTLVKTCRFQWYQYCWPIHCPIIDGATYSIFGSSPQRPRQLRWRRSGVKQQGLAAFQQCRNLAESCFREGTGSGVRKYIFFADYQNFRTVTLIPLALAGIDARAPFFSRRIRWTPPSFPWHNRVSAWLSLRVRASDYGWCPNIDRFL